MGGGNGLGRARVRRLGEKTQHDYINHVETLKRLFRAKMLALLKAVHAAGKLQFFNEHAHLADAAAFARPRPRRR